MKSRIMIKKRLNCYLNYNNSNNNLTKTNKDLVTFTYLFQKISSKNMKSNLKYLNCKIKETKSRKIKLIKINNMIEIN